MQDSVRLNCRKKKINGREKGKSQTNESQIILSAGMGRKRESA